MSEIPVNPNQPSSPSQASSAPKPSSRWKKATLAGLLALVFPGMGQLYNRQPRKAFSLALITHVLDMLLVKTRLLFGFSTMIATILTLGAWKLFVAAEASYTVATAKRPELAVPIPRLTYPFLAVVFFVTALIPFP